MLSAVINGFLISLSLIVAIGAQNAFVLKQGIKGEHVFWVCLLCALSDMLLIVIGVSGFHVLVRQFPVVSEVARWGGALFLIVYGARSFLSAYRGNNALLAQGSQPHSLRQALLLSLAFTWLNPHVYLDTVVFMGSISAQFEQQQKRWFAGGASLASLVWFFALGYGSGYLRPLFAKPIAWRVLDVLIGIIMWTIAVSLLCMGTGSL